MIWKTGETASKTNLNENQIKSNNKNNNLSMLTLLPGITLTVV